LDLVKIDVKRLKEKNIACFRNDELKKWFEDNTTKNDKGTISLKNKSIKPLKPVHVYEMEELAPLMSCFYYITHELKVNPLSLDFELTCQVISKYLHISLAKSKIYACAIILIPGEIFNILGGKLDGKE